MMTTMEFAGRMGNHIAAHAIETGCEIDSYAVVRDAHGGCTVAITRRELCGLRAVTKIFPLALIAQLDERTWRIGYEAEMLVMSLLEGDGALT